MRTLLLAVIVVLAFAATANATWYDNEVSSPGANVVVVDTGPLPSANHYVSAIVYSSLTGVFKLQQLDADGTTVLHEQRISVTAGQTNLMLPSSSYINTPVDDQRFRIITTSALTLGTVSASLIVN